MRDRTAVAVPLRRLLLATDAFALTDTSVADTVMEAARSWSITGEVPVFGRREADWLEAYRVLQGLEIHLGLGSRVASLEPCFGAAIARRFADAAGITEAEAGRWRPFRERCRQRLSALLPPGTALLLPTAPTIALPLDADNTTTGDFYRRALTLCSLAGHAGLPQRQFPAGLVDGCPVGLSLLGGTGTDLSLLDAVPEQ